MMNTRKYVQTLVMASMLAIAIMGVLGGYVQAAPKEGCTPETCGTETCTYPGGTPGPGEKEVYHGGETLVVTGGDGKLHAYMCDGFTGTWVLVGRTHTTPPRPVAPRPIGNARLS